MNINPIKATITDDADGVQIHLSNPENLREATYRIDKQLSVGKNVLYRVDMKPTTRQHKCIDGDPHEWIDKNINALVLSVM